MIKLIKQHSTFNPPVILASLLLVLFLSITSLIIPTKFQETLFAFREFVSVNFGWFYILTVGIFLIFIIFLALSTLGDIKLGLDDEEPEFSFTSWLAMLFAAGTGVGLMFFGVSEPLSHLKSDVTLVDGVHSAQQAVFLAMFHWGLNAWTVYGIMALALAYFGFRYKLPLSLRSCFYPILKDKLNGGFGHAVDAIALIVTIFGIMTTLGFGAAQLGAGLEHLSVINSNNLLVQIILVVALMSIAVLSAISGVGKGVKIISEINVVLALLFMLFVLFAGPTLHILQAFVDNFGYYLAHIVTTGFDTYAYEPQNQEWFNNWTVLFWAWWLSWTPFVGLFIARISKGRTIREFIFGVLVIPTIFTIVWFSIFGNTGIFIDNTVANGALNQLTGTPEKLLFAFLDYLPASSISSTLACLILGLFFITSADSGIYVLNNIATEDKSKSIPKWQCIMWGLIMVIITISLLSVGGLDALQSVTLIMALPFGILLLIMCYSLWRGLMHDEAYFSTDTHVTAQYWDSKNWKRGLSKILNQTTQADILQFLKYTALPAMYQLSHELTEEYGFKTTLNRDFHEEDAFCEICIEIENMRNYTYGIKAVKKEISEHMIDDSSLPHIQDSETVIPMTYFSDGRAGYDVQYMTRDDLIMDIIKNYERYLSLLDEVGAEMMAHDQEELGE
ncbi:BCCT family transporter [Veillonella sp.]|uniref:BCCT family transporter n=1 Tax=Veillonella sp. TaxID=1926307 RepID=UPI001B67439E|nr:BCCT family transporter [Veillonella sp.]MBP9516835.1 BCCT family transporter [Veillonella sp.]MBP9550832.1 BCCT family transporter [Veillonella sp.]